MNANALYNFVARVSAVNERFGGKAMPEWLALTPCVVGYRRSALAFAEIIPCANLADTAVGHSLGAHAWAAWLIDELDLLVSARGRTRRVIFEKNDVMFPEHGFGPTLIDACLDLLENWKGESPFEEDD